MQAPLSMSKQVEMTQPATKAGPAASPIGNHKEQPIKGRQCYHSPQKALLLQNPSIPKHSTRMN